MTVNSPQSGPGLDHTFVERERNRLAGRALSFLIGLNGIALLCVPLAVVWTLLALRIGRGYLQRDGLAPQGGTA